MKKIIKSNLRVGSFVLLFGIPIFAISQKLPHKQESNIWAPENVKIDGEINEWGNKFQAYNPVSRVFYTVSNDDKNFYLVIGTDDKFGTDKVLLGGVSLIIRPTAEKGSKVSKGADDISITYSTLSDDRKTEAITNLSHLVEKYRNDTITNKKKIDSLRSLGNLQMNNLFNKIRVTGIKIIANPLISVTNPYGIQAAVQFNNQMRYRYELAIPLKYFLSSINNGEKFSYDIKLNGLPEVGSSGIGVVHFANPISALPPDAVYMNYPTDFWGEYILAKK